MTGTRLVAFFASWVALLGKTWKIEGKIQTALQLSQPGDTLYLLAHRYTEYDLVVDKPLVILGAGSTLDVAYQGDGFRILADNVTLQHLRIQNIKVDYHQDYAAVKVEGAKNCRIEYCQIENAFFGIYLAKAQGCHIRYNKIRGTARSEANSGNAIHLWQCRDVLIEGNRVSSHRDGIYFEFVFAARVQHNQSTHNIRYGLHFMFSDSCLYRHNLFQYNRAGVAVMYSKNILIEKNTFMYHWQSISNGVLLKDVHDSQIRENTFVQNTTALYVEGCLRNEIIRNRFLHNGWAIKLFGSNEDNTFTENVFRDNFFDLTTHHAAHHANLFRRNYWDSYRGYDLKKDGVGDVPHRPLSLFTYLIELAPPIVILFQSLLLDLLDLIEKINPEFIPSGIEDTEPLMHPPL
ncbi:MAG: nitrous oxide reductase family maturation protein NosD [Bacteroidia bacterium]